MAASVILSEQKVIGLLRQYVQETELEPCSVLANTEQDLPQPPKIVTSLHNEILAGNWNKAIQLINSLNINNSDLCSMKYSICKQRYLESIDTLFSSKVQLEGKLKTLGKGEIINYVNPEQLKLVATHLKSLDGLCSQEDYFKLSFLISCPDLKTHPSYSDWNVQLGRLQTASGVCQQALKLKHPELLDNHHLPAGRPRSSSRLLQLVARGILYEKSEKLLQHRTGSSNYNHEHGDILDVHSWLAHLPDQVFQIPVHKLSLCIEELCSIKSCNPLSVVQPSSGHNCVAATASTVSLPEGTENKKTVMKDELPEGTENEKTMTKDENGMTAVDTQHVQEVVEDDGKAKEDVTDGDNITIQEVHYQNAEEDTERLTKYHLTQAINTETDGYNDDLQPAQEMDAPSDQRRDVITPENCHTEVQPLVNSSTPKPSHSKHMVEFPVTSPIDRDGEPSDYGPYHTPTSLRKQVITKNKSQVDKLWIIELF